MRSSCFWRATLFACVLVIPAMALQLPRVDAKPKVTCEVKVVARHPNLVMFTWEVRVETERQWDACDLIISFQDEKGREVHSLRETLGVRAGRSSFSGHDMCDSTVWSRVTKYVATFDCVI